MVEQLSPGANMPEGVTSDALIATMISYLTSREVNGHPRENDIMAQLVSSLASRMPEEAGSKINALLMQLQGLSAQTSDTLVAVAAVEMAPAFALNVSVAEIELPEVTDILPDAKKIEQITHILQSNPEPQSNLELQSEPEIEPDANQVLAEIDEWRAAIEEAEEPVVTPAIEDDFDIDFGEPLSPVIASVIVEAGRVDIAPDLANAIIASGAMPAILAVIRNPHAQLSRSSLTTLSELAVSDLSLKQALCSRSDLPEAIVDRLWPFLSLNSRAAMLTSGLSLSSTDAEGMRRDIETENAERIAAGEDVLTVAQAFTDYEAQHWSLSDAVTALAGSGGVAEVALLLAQVAGIDETIALSLFLGSYDRGTVIIARAAGADEGAFEAILAVRGRSGARRTSDRRSPMFAFQASGTPDARDLIAQVEATIKTALGDAANIAKPDANMAIAA
jgi:uncharacterized protein (DUF2336 family)